MDTVSVQVRKEIFERLQRLAEPLVDDSNSVIERLISHWEQTAPKPGAKQFAIQLSEPTHWRSARGERLPIGAKLRATYLGQGFPARITKNGIEFNGKTYDNPSSAGIAAKQSTGTAGDAASTNGWTFWEIQEPGSSRWISLKTYRDKV